MSTQYKNLNQFPVIVPSKRGSSFTILPGSSQSDPWFSRFCGAKQLTRVEVSMDGNYLKDAAKAKSKPTTPFADLVGEVQKESRYYRMVSDIYQCKLCDEYRTGSKEALKRHLKTSHKMDVPDVDYIGAGPKAPVVPTPKVPEASNPLKITSEMEAKIVETAKAVTDQMDKVAETITPKTFQCDICGRNFKSAAGLKTHKTVKHKDQNG